MKTSVITATEANRSFAKLLRAVERGERVEITSHGRKVAVIAPAGSDLDEKTRRDLAFAELRQHLADVKHVTVGRWTRDDLNQR